MTIEGTSFRLEVPRVPHFKIVKNGVEITLEEGEMMQLLSNREVRNLLLHMYSDKKVESHSGGVNTDNTISNNTSAHIPPNYVKILEVGSDPKSPHRTIFAYYKDKETGEYGFTTINDASRSPPHFSKLGRIEDPKSLIGSFIRDFIRWTASSSERPYIKHEIAASKTIRSKPDGRKMKALLDILKHQGYLRSQPVLEKRGQPGFSWTGKTDGLEDAWVKHELEKVHSSHPLSPLQ